MKQSNIISLFAITASLALLGAGCIPTSQTNTTVAPVVSPAPEQPSSNELPTSAPATTQPTTMVPPKVTPPAPAAAKKVSATIAGFSFQPNSIIVAVGDTITWTNNDGVPHTVTADDGSFDSGMVAPGATYSRTFSVPGAVPYHCSFHGSMHGSVTVTQ